MIAIPTRAIDWLRPAAFVLVTIVGLWLLWPVPLGEPPLSKDHTVHLSRAWMWADALARGAPRAYSEIWFFGTPIGEVYPVLGDAIVIAVRTASFGLLDWHTAYALGFTLVFVSQGWVMLRLARACGLGLVGGVVAALLVLGDPGAYREGGWIYTVDYGVWPQALANTMTYLALAEVVLALEADRGPRRRRAIVRAGFAIAAAVLAHQISLPVLVLMGTAVLAVFGVRRRGRFGETVATMSLAFGLGLLLAAWWLVPMLSVRGWMVSYGWLWQPLSWMVEQALRGHLAQGMPIAVTVVIVVGIVAVAIRGSDGSRAIVLGGVMLWLWTAEDTLWELRLDLFDRGFGQMQWQRFLIAAKPALMLAAGALLAQLVAGATAAWRTGGAWRAAAGGLVATSLGLFAWMMHGTIAAADKAQTGTPQVARDPEDPALQADFLALAEDLRARWRDDPDKNWRTTVVAYRNQHWFMDLPVLTGAPLYKQGFTPGDNFVHKPEAGDEAMLDRLGVRYVVTRRRAGVRNASVVATFGQLKLWERKSWRPVRAATTDGTATIDVVRDDPGGDGIEIVVRGASEGERLVFDVAGHPRWQLMHDGVEVPWFEAPAVGDGPDATIEQRRSGELTGGKADGDDGTEPTLVATAAKDGTFTLRYRVWRASDVLTLVMSLAAAFAAGGWWRRRGDDDRVEAFVARLAPRIRPWMVGGLVGAGVVLWLIRTHRGHEAEAMRAVGWIDTGAITAHGVSAGPFKTDMAIRPAVVVTRKRMANKNRASKTPVEHPPVVLRFAGAAGAQLTGWIAIEDDAAKLRGDGKHRVTIEVEGSDVPVFDQSIAHRPGRVRIDEAIATPGADLVVTITSTGEAPPPLGFDLELGARAP
jgi:hypothetical protein